MISHLHFVLLPVLITWLIVLGCLGLLIRRNGTWWMMSIPGLYLMVYAVFNVVGAPFLIGDYNAANLRYLFAVNLGMLVHTAVYLAVDRLYGFDFRSEMNAYLTRPLISQDENGWVFRTLFLAFLAVVVGVSVVYLVSLKSIPLVDVVFRPTMSTALAVSRDEATTSFEGKYYRYTIFFKMLLPFLNLVVFVLAHNLKTRFWKRLFWSTLAFCVFMHIADLQKAPVIFYLMTLLFLNFLLKQRVSRRTVILFGSGIVLLLVLMYVYIMGAIHGGAWRVFRAIGLRLFMAQTLGTQATFRLFPDIKDFLMGATFPNPGGLLPIESFELTKYVFTKAFGYSELIQGTAPCTYYMEFYANFGYSAMIASMFVGAFLLQWLQILFLRIPKTAYNLGFYAFMIVHISHLALMGSSAVLGPPFIIMMIFVLGFQLAYRTLKEVI